MSESLVEEFTSQSNDLLDDLKRYCTNNYSCKLGAKDSVRHIAKQFTEVINLAVEKIKKSCMTNILEQTLTKLARKDDILEISKIQEDKYDDKLESFKDQIEKIFTENLGKLNCSPVPSYSDVVKRATKDNKPTLKPRKNKHTLLIYNNNNKDSSEKTKEILLKRTSPIEMGVGINNIRSIRNGGLAVNVENEEDLQVLQCNVKLVPELSSKIGKSRRPLVKIVNVPITIKRENLGKCIYEQNVELTNTYEFKQFEEEVAIRFQIKQRDPELQSWVLELSPKIRGIFMEKRKVFIEWSRCSIFDYIPIYQCFKCLKFGHFANNCSSQNSICSHCGGYHLFKDCKNKEEAPKCTNCIGKHVNTTDHNAMDKSCPTYCNYRASIISRLYSAC
ncbi:uncharacterized protein LOC111641916 [Centruroides sculpturatus]|uniref:uncharacterized protein LOC111641916 n=1 Tax=Centruroides sculpturatus TaxID=218467 RepID=UPI000C6DC813|nr:uncharacterized protein LOC111641916 [Centruroides sculpturatus]